MTHPKMQQLRPAHQHHPPQRPRAHPLSGGGGAHVSASRARYLAHFAEGDAWEPMQEVNKMSAPTCASKFVPTSDTGFLNPMLPITTSPKPLRSHGNAPDISWAKCYRIKYHAPATWYLIRPPYVRNHPNKTLYLSVV